MSLATLLETNTPPNESREGSRIKSFRFPVLAYLENLSTSAAFTLFNKWTKDKPPHQDTSSVASNRIAMATPAGTNLLVQFYGAGVDGQEPEQHILKLSRDLGWQASIGGSAVKSEFIPEKQTRTVNGKSVKGPAVHVQKMRLKETSFVPLGADVEYGDPCNTPTEFQDKITSDGTGTVTINFG